MTPAEHRAVLALVRCSFLPGSWVKRFSRSLAGLDPSAELTVKQRAALMKQLCHYRRQLPRDVVEWVELERTGQRILTEQENGMTEANWLACVNSKAMLDYLLRRNLETGTIAGEKMGYRTSRRKLRLFVAAGLPIVIPESLLAPTVMAMADDPSIPPDPRWWPTDRDVASAASCVTTASYHLETQALLAAFLHDIAGNPFRKPSCGWETVRAASAMSAAALESGASEEAVWHGDWCINACILAIAQRIYDERDWLAMPILADALEDGGCSGKRCEVCLGAGNRTVRRTNPGLSAANGYSLLTEYHEREDCRTCKGTGQIPNPIISHLRGPGPHTRGCWVIDGILGRS